MKSSAIGLHFTLNPDTEKEYLVNLIDSPGHVDFTSEVTTAIRLCDGAIVVVDVIEGVCAQTKVALELAYREQLRPVLVLNKIDRLILEKQMSSLDAYVHLQQVLEQVNAVTGEMFTKTALEKIGSSQTDVGNDKAGAETRETFDWDAGLDDIDDSTLYFNPAEGNVAFTSAIDGWGFSIEDFARIYSKKLGVRFEVLRRTLWGDYYLNTKAKKIQRGAQAKAKKPLFAQLVLQAIFDVYETVCVNMDNVALEKMCASLGVKLQARDLRQTDPRVKVSAMLGAWLPLSRATLRMVCTWVPPPDAMSDQKVNQILNIDDARTLPEEIEALKKVLSVGDPSPSAPVIIFVSKMFAVERSSLPENKAKPLTMEEMAERRAEAKRKLEVRSQKGTEKNQDAAQSEHGKPLDEKQLGAEQTTVPSDKNEEAPAFIGFARVFSGTLRKGAELYVLGPKHNPQLFKSKNPTLHVDPARTLKDLKADEHVTRITIDRIYLLMGKELAAVDEVPAGNILGIGGLLENHVAKYATLSSSVMCPPFTDLTSPVVPILRVALEPKKLKDMPKLVQGMKLLNQADPCVQVILQETGEHVLVTAGEVHLERCLLDLKERFAKIDISASEPIVAFRETVVEPPKTDMVNEVIDTANRLTIKDEENNTINADKSVTLFTASRQSSLTIKALPLPDTVAVILDSETALMKEFDAAKEKQKEEHSEIDSELTERVRIFREKLQKAFDEAEMDLWKKFDVERIWSFGPKKCGPNVLINSIDNFHVSYWRTVDKSLGERQSLESNVVSGFQLASFAGPLCEEPLRKVAFVVSKWDILSAGEDTHSSYGPLSGQIMATVKEACRKSFQVQPQRLMAAMYECSIGVTAEALRKMYSVVGRRHGRITAGDLVEGSSCFEIRAVLPVIESFRLADELRKQTSGLAQPQLIFSHWEVIDVDPFWVPCTEEELLHFGEKADSENRAMKYMNQVRRRKGLKVREHVVEHAEKQRTLSKKK
ncbi:elongation factor Tu GTP-binding domain-containing protein 1-like [Tropilaelaps mercedesae]|uniref:Elongation factor-like 1 n=1 Tax=Tropilaelaps mercedesae TaxID=418985 RepID=A0A1V9XAY4_9ACAR|nr:elongation factor Tu GTP-binding domain-containing protein 1-like [Tropilaelaps mercedesae]